MISQQKTKGGLPLCALCEEGGKAINKENFMKHIQKRLGSLFMAAVMLLSMAATPAMASEKKDPPTAVTNCAASGFSATVLALGFSDTLWMDNITSITVNETAYSKGKIFSFGSDTGIWEIGSATDAYGSFTAIKLAMRSDTAYPATIMISADGYKGLSVKVERGKFSTYTATAEVAENIGSGGESEKPGTPENSTVDLSKVSFATSFDGNDWQASFDEAGYADKISGVSVNGTAWETASLLTRGGQYKIDGGRLLFARKSYGAAPALKSGDSITVTATGYNALTFKLIIDLDGNASAAADGGMGDPYALHVKIEGSFEAAIVGQKDYDGVSSASVGGASSNKNSAVTVYGALTEKGNTPADDDWIPLGHQSKLRLNGSKSSV